MGKSVLRIALLITMALLPIMSSAMTIAVCKSKPDGASVICDPCVVTSSFPGFYYIEETSRASGICVITNGRSPEKWSYVQVSGKISTSGGERFISCDDPTIVGTNRTIFPLWMQLGSLGGGDFCYSPNDGAGQMGIVGRVGLNNIGLLVKLSGSVQEIEPPSFVKPQTWFSIGDSPENAVRVVVPFGVTINPAWQFATVTGISSLDKTSPIPQPVVLVRDLSDILTYGWELKALIVARPESAAPGQVVKLDGRLSTSGMPGRPIAAYEWDFDYNGMSFDIDATGAEVQHQFTTFGAHTVALRVKDNPAGPHSVISTAVVNVNQGNLPPLANTGGPYVIGYTENLVLDASSSTDPNVSAGDSIVKYEWDLNNDGIYADAVGSPVTVSWATLWSMGLRWGNCIIGVRVTDQFGATSTRKTTIGLYPNTPLASFTVTPQTVLLGGSVSLDASISTSQRPDRSIVSYEWDFHYNLSQFHTEATGVTATFTPSAFGYSNIALRVTNNGLPAKSSLLFKVVPVTFDNHPPTSIPGGPYFIDQGANLTLDGRASSDPDSGLGDSIYNCSWDFNNDGVYDMAGPLVTIPWASIQAQGLGVHTVNFITTDQMSASTLSSTTFTVFENLPKAAIIARPSVAPPGYVVLLDGTGSSIDRTDRQIVSYEWDFNYDGITFHPQATGATTSHAYSAIGPYVAALRVTDNNLPPKTNIATKIITVNTGNVAPCANSGLNYTIEVGSALSLNGGGSFDPNPGDLVVSYKWYLNADSTADAVGAYPVIPWSTLVGMGISTAGSYTIRLTVTDAFGLAGSENATLKIYGSQPTARFSSLPPTKVGGGEAFAFDASASSHENPARSIVSYQWDFSYDLSNFNNEGSGRSISHSYPGIGTYRVALRVTDDLGRTNITYALVTVEARNAPVAKPGGAYIVDVGSNLALDGSQSYDADMEYGDSIVQYAWDINGDGNFGDAVGVKPTLTWTQLHNLLQAAGLSDIGVYQISLKVTDTTGRTNTAYTVLITYKNEPTAILDALTTTAAPAQFVTFDASLSYHDRPDRHITSYEWDYDYNGITFDTDAIGKVVSHAFPTFGAHTVALRITDDNFPAKIRIATVAIQVNQGNLAPVAHPGAPYTITAGSPLALNGSQSYDPNASAGDSIISYGWDINNDGMFDDAMGANPVISGAYISNLGIGSHTIMLRVTDTFGTIGTSYTRLDIK